MVPDGIEIGYCNFVTQTAAEVNCDIYIAQTDMINIHDCNFTHAIPTGGENRYIKANAASTGIVANCSFATATLVTGTIMTLNGIIESGSTCALGFLTS